MSNMARVSERMKHPSFFKCMISAALTAFLFLLLAPALLVAETVEEESAFHPEPGIANGQSCLRIAETLKAAPLAKLQSAETGAADQVAAIAEWNKNGNAPLKNGFQRPLAVPTKVSLGLVSKQELSGSLFKGVFLKDAGDLVWSATIEVEDAKRLRLHLSGVNLPEATVLWVYGEDPRDITAFDTQLMAPDGGLWTPSVEGETISLEVRIPAIAVADQTSAGFTIDSVMELFDIGLDGVPLTLVEEPEGTECYLDAACYGDTYLPNLDHKKWAYGHMHYVSGGNGYLCTGALMNDKDSSTFVPYFYTAYHCIGNQSEASSLEAYFDYIPDYCGGPPPSHAVLPKVNGSTLLVAYSGSDSTLLRLNYNPSGNRLYLGWSSSWFSNGYYLYRLAHPTWDGGSRSMVFARHSATGPRFGEWAGHPTSHFIYSQRSLGGSGPGASGAPVMDSAGYVRGQTTGRFGTNISDYCSTNNDQVDGRFSEFFPYARPYLDPSGGGGTSPCAPNATTMCLNNGRFEVRVGWRNQYGSTGQGWVVPLGGYASNDSGLFWFFNSANWEMLIKILNGCGANGRYWVFFAATTDQEFTVLIRDTYTGWVKTYYNALKHPANAVTDTNAFATCP